MTDKKKYFGQQHQSACCSLFLTHLDGKSMHRFTLLLEIEMEQSTTSSFYAHCWYNARGFAMKRATKHNAPITPHTRSSMS